MKFCSHSKKRSVNHDNHVNSCYLLILNPWLGFMIGDVVRDKDGISALGVFAEWAQVIQAEQGLSMTEYLKSLYHE